MKTIVYYLAISALFTHELDAVLNFEWRLLFHLFNFPEAFSSALFIGLHFPLFFLFFYLGQHSNLRVRNRFRFLVCALLIVHGFAHFWLAGHEKYYFEGLLSNLYIYGSAVLGLVFVLLCWQSNTKNAQ